MSRRAPHRSSARAWSSSAPRAALFAAAAISLGGGASAAAGCNNLVVHTFVGQHYDKTNDCLDPKGVIDVVDGAAHGTCTGVRCYVSQTKDASGGLVDGDVFVSASCEPGPGFRDGTLDADGSTCALALEAYARGTDGACKTSA